jgi:hypothetical protein
MRMSMDRGVSPSQSASGGATYTGVFDVSGSQWPDYYALRAASAAIAAAGTQLLVNVRATATTPANVLCDIVVASNGGLGLTANCSTGSYNGQAAATFCASGSGSCVIQTLYDQGSGAHNLGSGNSATLVFSCNGA